MDVETELATAYYTTLCPNIANDKSPSCNIKSTIYRPRPNNAIDINICRTLYNNEQPKIKNNKFFSI
jgi:hypothetical protein